MVHFHQHQGSSSILVSEVNQTTTRAAGFFIFYDQNRLKCEYFVRSLNVNLADLNFTTKHRISSRTLKSALDVWQDALIGGPVVIISDVDLDNDESREVRVMLHELKLKRCSINKNLNPIKFVRSTTKANNARNNVGFKSLVESVHNLLQGTKEGCESFKEILKTTMNQPIQFNRL